MRLLIKLLVETSPEGREEINVVAQKTVTNSDIIILDKLFSGKAANFASLVMKLDPAESASYPPFNQLSWLFIGRHNSKNSNWNKKVHRRKHNALLSISLILRLPLKRVSRRKFLNAPVERTSVYPDPAGTCTSRPTIRVGTPLPFKYPFTRWESHLYFTWVNVVYSKESKIFHLSCSPL